ncbi:MAG: flagellar biosynthesis protein FlhB [Treponema sp.]|jgi:flagellar biosynthetic protein FlhB|nr:flagellar biosynthesis protein FlhB [Treponema sp.]
MINPWDIDLQWFADDDKNRTEEPTEVKLKRLKEKEGQVPKSQEFVGALGLFLPALVILFFAPFMLRTCVEMVRFFLLRAVEMEPVGDRRVAFTVFLYLARLVSPILITAVIAALFSNLVQTGFIFTTKPLEPDFNRILPRVGKFFQRTLFSVDGVFNFFKSIIKMIIIGAVAWILIRSNIEKLLNLQKMDLWLGFTTVASLAARMLIISALLLLLLSIPDYMFQRWRFRERNKMTREEVKKERKQYEPDPMIQDRIRRRMRVMMTQNMETIVPQANVVITNPTHFAVALKYEQGWAAPQVTAKGVDEIALRIRRIAAEHEVPVVENRPLARALYQQTEVGDLIPVRFYNAVIDVLVYVYRLNAERRQAEGMRA